MIALLLDSSDKNLTVAFSKDGQILSSISYEAWQRQSEFMIEEIHKQMASLGLKRDDLNAVVASKGPGSYTGIRIALTIAKTVSFALNLPLYLVSSLEALEDKDHTSICLMNARGKRSYMAVYRGEIALMEDCIKDNSEVMDYIFSHSEYVPCGDLAYLGMEGYRANIAENLSLKANEAHLCDNPLGARPVYLKDDYEAGKFKTIVRKAIASDLSQIAAIEDKTFKHPYTKEQILYEMNENPCANFYCAVVDSEVVGFIDFMITFSSATISQIAVKEEFRSKGIGNLLLGQLLKDCASQEEPVEYLTLEVRESNVRAQKFYKKHKFEAVTVKKSYYDDGENAVYMVRSLING